MIRHERLGDEAAIADLIGKGFANSEHSDGSEAAIVARLRVAQALTLSLVFADGDQIVGHVAFSPVTISKEVSGWFGLGPVAVDLAWRRKGIGAALIGAGLAELRLSGATGCVVLGDPGYYARFEFRPVPQLRYPHAPAQYFQALAWNGEIPAGEVSYDLAFG